MRKIEEQPAMDWRYQLPSIPVALNKPIQAVSEENVNFGSIKLIQSTFDCSQGQHIILKIYDFNRDTTDISQIYKEIRVAKSLLDKANDSNCFLQNITFTEERNFVKISIDSFSRSLRNAINAKLPITIHQKLLGISSLLQSFAVMTEMGINYYKISPNSILLTPTNAFKLNYMVPAEILREFQRNVHFGQFITEPTAYLAPELLKMAYKGVDHFQFDSEKAQVFSLGLCIYELFTYQSTFGWNSETVDLNPLISNIPSEKVKKLLKEMLKFDEYQRPTFKQCLEIFNVEMAMGLDLAHAELLYENDLKGLLVWGNTDFAVKIYDNMPKGRLKILRNEVSILETILERADENNLFLKFLFSRETEFGFCIATERLNLTLYQYFINQEVNQKILEEIFFKLLKFFSELEKIGIYHRDITPKNIMIGNGLKIKVISYCHAIKFGEKKQRKTNIVNSYDYLAPELRSLINNSIKKSICDPRKTDVFALGITILQTFARLDSVLNFSNPDFNKELIEYSQQLNVSAWVKSLLANMLHISPDIRNTFTELANYSEAYMHN